ncbi:hypothetical protein BO82DRAFT_400772 [Aspergillus uvarum CBS 121591]|uniref:Uncharacterized protein n=1 Tax=Aspergillus uvarum CBS 121591 TaxID=1448315 RepID=A0A319CDV7_9EURO|nr:hypothetical protein BO82DRAFT_400772 [Aspergillus uvarum CBS 121591]PYH83384.1 hypothetical protein BO82DRAFT_400772 [Aspergillus uvarum CBS 121591]
MRSNSNLLAVTAFPDAFLYYLTGMTNDNPDDPPTQEDQEASPASLQAREIARIASGGFMIRMDTISSITALVADAFNCLYPPWASAPVGINDINVHSGFLYWINAAVATPSRIQLTNDGYATAGAESELVAESQQSDQCTLTKSLIPQARASETLPARAFGKQRDVTAKNR